MSEGAPWEHLVSERRLHALHERALRDRPGAPGGPLPGCLDSSLGAAYAAEGYILSEANQEGLLFAGHLLFYLAKNHCYVDGNKRLAWLAAIEVLAKLGLALDVTTDDAEAFVNDVVTGALEQPGLVVTWMASRLIALDLS